MNCAVFEDQGQLLVLDCGVSFPDDDAFGIDQIVPDFEYITSRADDVAGILITHGHQDHIGALPLLLEELDVPVYIPRFAAGLLRHALAEAGFGKDEVEIHVIAAGDVVEIGPFKAEFVHVTHSIPDTLAVALGTSVGTLVHTADFKIDRAPFAEPPIDLDRLRAIGDEGVRVLFSDSTNVLRDTATRSESDVRKGLEAVVRAAPGRVLCTMFSTNMFRIQALVEIAQATDRRLLLLGRSLQRNTRLARDLGILKLPDDVFIDEKSARGAAPSSLIIACTGSQAQSRAALARMAYDSLAGFKIQEGDHVVFSARSIPGNEGAIARLLDQIVRRGGVIVNSPDIHCSGHACRPEQEEMLRTVRPKSFVPVHGDHRFLVAHAELAATTGVKDSHVLDNGDVLEITERHCRKVERIEAERVAMDGTPIGGLGGDALRMRRRMAERGVALLIAVVDEETVKLDAPPEIENFGLFDEDLDDGMIDAAVRAAERAFGKLSEGDRLDEDACGEAMRVAVMRQLRRDTDRKPLVVPIVIYL